MCTVRAISMAFIASALLCGAEVHAQGYNQRLGVITDAGSSYKYYNTPPTRQQLSRNEAILDAEIAKINADRVAVNKRWESSNEARVLGKKTNAENNKMTTDYNDAIAQINIRNNRLELRSSELKEEIRQNNIARESSTESEFIQRLGVTSPSGLSYKYYDSDGRLLSEKLDAAFSRSNATSAEINKAIVQARFDKDSLMPLRDRIVDKKAKYDEWFSALNAYDAKTVALNKDRLRRTKEYNVRVNSFNENKRATNDAEAKAYNRQLDSEIESLRSELRWKSIQGIRQPAGGDHR